jgi:hypothetical protein
MVDSHGGVLEAGTFNFGKCPNLDTGMACASLGLVFGLGLRLGGLRFDAIDHSVGTGGSGADAISGGLGIGNGISVLLTLFGKQRSMSISIR